MVTVSSETVKQRQRYACAHVPLRTTVPWSWHGRAPGRHGPRWSAAVEVLLPRATLRSPLTDGRGDGRREDPPAGGQGDSTRLPRSGHLLKSFAGLVPPNSMGTGTSKNQPGRERS